MIVGESMRRGMSTRWTWAAVGLCLALRIPFIGVPLNIDEGGDVMIARAWSHTHGSIYGQYWLDRSPVLLMLYRFGLVGGDIGVRLMGMVAAVLVVVGTILAARRVAGTRAAGFAGFIAAALTGSMITGAALTDAELLACVPSVFSIVALLIARKSSTRALRWFALAGLLAGVSILIKQSFLDALAAGVVLLVASAFAHRSSGFRTTWAVSYVAGALVGPALCLVWAWRWSSGVGNFLYSQWGFRLDAVSAQQRMSHSSLQTFQLGLVFLVLSGAAVLLPWTIWQLVRIGRSQQRVLAACLTAWLLAGIVGVAGGGNYFAHYFIQLVPVCAVVGGAGLAACAHRTRWLARVSIAALVVLVLVNIGAVSLLMRTSPPQERVHAIASYLHRVAQRGDTGYVMYARANLAEASNLRMPFPYEWSLMMETIPGAERQLRAWLASSERPTWIVEWQQPTAFGLDRSGATRSLLQRYYRPIRMVCGKLLLHRAEQSRAIAHDFAPRCPGPTPLLSADALDGLWG